MAPPPRQEAKTDQRDTSMENLPALDSNRPREEWDFSHVRLEDVSPNREEAAKQLTNDDEVVALNNVLKASMEPLEDPAGSTLLNFNGQDNGKFF